MDYDHEDGETLASRQTHEDVRDITDGRNFTGIAEIKEAMEADVAANDFKVPMKAGTHEVLNDGGVIAKGTYHVKGTAAGEPVDITGTYTNTLVKVNGEWKVSKNVLVQDQ